MPERKSWKAVAQMLASRLNHATAGHCAAHREPEPGADCPFCKDILALRMYRTRKAQETRHA